MNKNIVLTFLIVIALASCKLINNRTLVITGKITDKLNSRIEYSLPMNGISYFGFKEPVNPDSLGNFRIILKIDKPSIIEFFTGYDCNGALVVEPGMDYEVFINKENRDSAFTIICKNEEGQKLFNKLKNRSMMDGHFEKEARDFIKNSDPDNIKKTLISRKEDDISGFRNLLEKKLISKEFFNLVQSDREYYYSGALGSIAFINYLYKEAGQNSLNQEQYENLWKEVFQIKPITDIELLSSPWFYYYIQNYLRYKELIIESADTKEIRSLS